MPQAPRRLSDNSTQAVPDSIWFCSDFLLGAGTVIIQPTTRKVVLLYDHKAEIWFLPKGRKDVGESLEQAALREAYEESGYRAQFLPLNIPTRAPRAPIMTPHETSEVIGDDPPKVTVNSRLNTEPIYVATHYFERPAPRNGAEYITFWYVAFIGPDAIREEDTGMSDEKHFQSHLMSSDEAVKKLTDTGGSMEAYVVGMAYQLWLNTERSEGQRT